MEMEDEESNNQLSQVSSVPIECSQTDPSFKLESKPHGKKLQTPRFARELVRNSVSTRAGASLANALIRELVDCQMLDISPD